MSDRKKSAGSTSSRLSELLSDEERAAMQETLEERRRALSGEADGERDVLTKIAEMAEPDRTIARRIHAILKASAPALSPRSLLWDARLCQGWQGGLLLSERAEVQDEVRDAGFQDKANLDAGAMWPTAFALTELTPAVEAKIGTLVRKAAL